MFPVGLEWLCDRWALCSRGEVVSKAGPEEAIIYADIGEWEEPPLLSTQGNWWSLKQANRLPTGCRSAVFSRNSEADPDYNAASARPLHGVSAGRVIRLIAATWTKTAASEHKPRERCVLQRGSGLLNVGSKINQWFSRKLLNNCTDWCVWRL